MAWAAFRQTRCGVIETPFFVDIGASSCLIWPNCHGQANFSSYCRIEENRAHVSNAGPEAARLHRMTNGRPPTFWVRGVPHARQKGDPSHETSDPHQKETSEWTQTKGIA